MRNSSVAGFAFRVVVAAGLAFTPFAASAQFAGVYGPSQATISTSHGGSVDTSAAPNAITLFGGSDSLGLSDQTYGFTLAGSGDLSFNWAYQQNDCCGASWDPFGYSLNGTFFQLTNDVGPNAQSGFTSLALNSGDLFAFDQRSLDSASGFGKATVSNFSAPGAVPEPATWAMMILGFGAMGVSLRRRRTVGATQIA